MGAGKTSVGRRLAVRLGMPFADADAEIEAAAGCTIPDLFTRYGERQFRDGERRVIRRLLAGTPMVLAFGGGAFMDPETRAAVREIGDLGLAALPGAGAGAPGGGPRHRPLLAGAEPAAVLERLIAATRARSMRRPT